VQWCNDGNFYGKDNESPVIDGEWIVKKLRVWSVVESLDSKEAGNLLIKNAWVKWQLGESIKFPCFSLHKFAVLKCNGDLVPCLTYFDRFVGNIREETPEKIWNGILARAERDHIKKCPGCLNSWGAGESYYAAFYPYLQYLKQPKEIIKAIGGK
jgi:hypothetical protein